MTHSENNAAEQCCNNVHAITACFMHALTMIGRSRGVVSSRSVIVLSVAVVVGSVWHCRCILNSVVK